MPFAGHVIHPLELGLNRTQAPVTHWEATSNKWSEPTRKRGLLGIESKFTDCWNSISVFVNPVHIQVNPREDTFVLGDYSFSKANLT